MRRALGLALLAAALIAAPAGAAVPGPTVLDFEDQDPGTPISAVYPGSGVSFIPAPNEDCGAAVREEPRNADLPGGHFGPRYLDAGCPTQLTLAFSRPQATVSLFVTVYSSGFNPNDQLVATAFDARGAEVAKRTFTPAPDDWSPVVLSTPDPRITRVFIDTTHFDLYVDDVGFSPSPQPDVDITGGPAGTVSSGDVSFTFAGNQDRMSFTCSLDGGAAQPCSSPRSYPGLADGGHTFEVTGTDRWGTADATPASQRFVVSRPVPVLDRDGDGVADGGDNCPDVANAGQGDGDADGVGDACELLPSGNTPVEAGKAATVKLVSGEVFVKLPPGATGSAFTTGLRVPFQSSGFVSLKGVASVPMGSTLDTRAGEVSVTAAVNGQRPKSAKQLRREARFRAGIFAVRQARKARKAKRSKTIPPRAELASPPGAEARCRANGPAKGTAVRSLVTNAKGVFRTVGGAATATPVKGTTTFITTDRCDGTVTEVGRGRVAVVAKRSGKRQVVRAGRAYIVRAKLFAARKGRPR